MSGCFYIVNRTVQCVRACVAMRALPVCVCLTGRLAGEAGTGSRMTSSLAPAKCAPFFSSLNGCRREKKKACLLLKKYCVTGSR